jgi:SP family general alpha glucoside:H+ symporter-like MFS transporter
VALTDNQGPWWLVRKGRLEDAKTQLKRLAVDGYYSEQKLDETVALMVHTNEMEKAEVAGTGFTDCFKGTNRRRTEIVRVMWCHQLTIALCGMGNSILVR